MDLTSPDSWGLPPVLVSVADHTETQTLECLPPDVEQGECVAGPGESSLVTRFDRTIVSTPEPATVWLVGTGLLFWIAWSRRARARAVLRT
jgi:hypothetical protein